jgi:ubiquinone biosynthesis protein
MLHTYAQMMFQSDRFHADPHPGNLIAQPDERLGVVDFGEVGYINAETRNALVRLLVAVLGRDSAALAEAVLAVSRSTHDVDRRGLGPDLRELFHALRPLRTDASRPSRHPARDRHPMRKHGERTRPRVRDGQLPRRTRERVAVANSGERST